MHSVSHNASHCYIHIAYWVAHRAIKLVYDIDDGLREMPEGMSIEILKSEVFNFFNVSYLGKF